MLESFDNPFEAAHFGFMMILHALYFLVCLLLHLLKTLLHFGLDLLYAVTRKQDRFNARQIDAQVLHQTADLDNAIDVAVRVETRTMRATTLTRRRDKAQAFIVTQRLLMYLGFFRRHTDDIPCTIVFLWHDQSLLSPLHPYYPASTPRLRASFSKSSRSSLE